MSYAFRCALKMKITLFANVLENGLTNSIFVQCFTQNPINFVLFTHAFTKKCKLLHLDNFYFCERFFPLLFDFQNTKLLLEIVNQKITKFTSFIQWRKLKWPKMNCHWNRQIPTRRMLLQECCYQRIQSIQQMCRTVCLCWMQTAEIAANLFACNCHVHHNSQ